LKSHDVTPTRAWVLHPDIKSDPDRRPGQPAVEEAVSLAVALPNLEVCRRDIGSIRQNRNRVSYSARVNWKS
jgi:hypothetical protein